MQLENDYVLEMIRTLDVDGVINDLPRQVANCKLIYHLYHSHWKYKNNIIIKTLCERHVRHVRPWRRSLVD